MPDTNVAVQLYSLPTTDEPNKHQLIPIRIFCSRFPWPSEAAMRSYIYRAHELGISNAFVRVRRRVLVDPEKFFFLIKQIESRSDQGGFNEATKSQKGTAHL
jgi:hypothetical protein